MRTHFPAPTPGRVGVAQGGGLVTDLPLVAPVFRDSTGKTANQITYTWNNRPIGAEEDRDGVVIGVIGRDNANSLSVASVTIGGHTPLTLLNNAEDDGSNSSLASFFGSNDPTGTTATVVVTFSAEILRAALCLWPVKGVNLAPAASNSHHLSSSAADIDLSLTPTKEESLALAIAVHKDGGAAWTGLTQDNDPEPLDVEAIGVSCGSALLSGTDPHTITCDPVSASSSLQIATSILLQK